MELFTLIIAAATLVWSIIWAVINNRQLHRQTLELENIKKENDNQNHITQAQFDFEFKTYISLCEMFGEMISDTTNLYPIALCNEGSDEKFRKEMYIALVNKAAESYNLFTTKLETYEPFIDPNIVEEYYKIKSLCSQQIEPFMRLRYNLTLEQQRKNPECLKCYERTKQIMDEHEKFNDKLRVFLRLRNRLVNFY